MQWQISIYADDIKRWVQVGPVFSSEEEATRFLDSFATPLKRLVQISGSTETEATTSPAELDIKRLEFAKFLVKSGRVNDRAETLIKAP